jgi:hypothetical protein
VSNSKENRKAAMIFYITFVVFVIVEIYLFDGIKWASAYIGLRGFGSLLAYYLFILGGWFFASLELKHTKEGEEIPGVVLKFCCWLQRKTGFCGFLITSGTLGPVAATFATKQTGRYYRLTDNSLACFAGLTFASVWIPFFVLTGA